MQGCDVVELAALVAVHGPALIQKGRISESALEQYWKASKARLDGWFRSLQDYLQTQKSAETGSLSGATHTLAWREVRPVIEEVLVSEVLTRIWTAVACAYDRQRGREQQVEPVAWSTYLGHLEARNRALNVLVYGRGFTPHEALQVNRLRRRCERWCDMLLGYIVAGEGIEQLAFEPQRTQEFAQDIREELNRPLSPMAWQLVLSALRAAFQQSLDKPLMSDLHNQQIASAILSCFGSELFDATGLVRTLWMERIAHITSDTEGLIEELIALDDGVGRIVVLPR